MGIKLEWPIPRKRRKLEEGNRIGFEGRSLPKLEALNLEGPSKPSKKGCLAFSQERKEGNNQ